MTIKPPHKTNNNWNSLCEFNKSKQVQALLDGLKIALICCYSIVLMPHNGGELAKAVNKIQHIGINARLAPICCYHFVLQAWAVKTN